MGGAGVQGEPKDSGGLGPASHEASGPKGAAVAPPQNTETMKAEKWREMSGEELQQKVKELSEELFNLRFQLSMGVAKNPSRVGQARRDLARAKTVLRERELTGSKR